MYLVFSIFSLLFFQIHQLMAQATIVVKNGRSHQMRTLAHEIVHARQFVEGRLLQCDH